MQFGMPTLLETPTAEEALALGVELGLQFVELNMNLPQYQPSAVDAGRLRALGEKYGLYCTLHIDENFDVCAFNPLVAEAYRRSMDEALRLAAALGAPVVNMHMQRGVFFKLPDRKVYLYNQYKDRYLAALTGFRDLCAEAVKGTDLHICIENTDGFTEDFLREGVALLLESPAFALTFDVGHSFGAGGVDAPFYAAHAARLRHIHLHDADASGCHMALGTGKVDIGQYLDIAKAGDCRVVVETKTVRSLRDSAAWLAERGLL